MIWGDAGKAEMRRTHGQVATFSFICRHPPELAKDVGVWDVAALL